MLLFTKMAVTGTQWQTMTNSVSQIWHTAFLANSLARIFHQWPGNWRRAGVSGRSSGARTIAVAYGWSEEQVQARMNQPGPGQAKMLEQFVI